VIGGLSESDLDRKDSYEYSNDTYDANYYVMGGAIEPHNGVVRLAKHWPSCGSAGFIHIYGDGSDSNNLIKISNTNRYVRYLGKVSRSEYLNAADRSLGVIVLRYSDGLDSKYFFPSKFLEACALRKNVYCNKFTNFPEELSGYVDFIESNMSDVKNIMSLEYNNKKTREEISQRIIFIRQHYTWNGAMNKIHEALNQ
jgi:glycosyltransferase involved in cell wall biosynthesis